MAYKGILKGVLLAVAGAAVLAAPSAQAAGTAQGQPGAPVAATQATAAPVKAAVFPWRINAPEGLGYLKGAMRDMFVTRIASAGGVEMVKEDAVFTALKPYKGEELGEAAALEAGRKLGADYALYGSLTVVGQSVSLDAMLLNLKDGSVRTLHAGGVGMDSVLSSVDKVAAEAAAVIAPRPRAAAPVQSVTPGTVSGVTAPPAPAATTAADGGFIVKAKEPAAPSFFKSAPIEGGYIVADHADMEKDGVRELLLLGPRALLIARLRGGALETVKAIEAAPGSTNVQMAVLDLDGDGAEEAYITSLRSGSVETSVVEYAGGGYRVAPAGVSVMLRAVPAASGKALVGQAFRPSEGFYGPIKEFRREGGRLVESGAYSVRPPRSADLFRFTLLEPGSPSSPLAVIDKRNNLRLYKPDGSGGWAESYASEEQYGGTLNHIEPETGGAGAASDGPWKVEGRFISADLDGDGRPELIVRRNTPGGLGRYASVVRSYGDGRVEAVAPEEGGPPTLKWKTKDVKGYVADFFIADLDGDGTRELVLLVVEDSYVGSPKSYILLGRLSI